MKKLPSVKQVESWKTPGRHAVGFGCYLQISGENGRSWVFRYERDGRGRHIGLGPVRETTLSQARDKALQYRRMLRDEGIDPLESRAAIRAKASVEAAKGITFEECADRYIAAHEATWKSATHRKQWRTTLAAYVYPIVGTISVSAIDTALISKVLEPIWTAKPETAGRVRGRVESVLDWAKARGYRDGENPARWRGHLENLLPNRHKVRAVKHHAALPYAEIPAFLAKLRTRDGIAARALEFLILTAVRTGEVLGARWNEFSGDVWTIPAERMKAGRDHRVPLSKRAVAILAALPRDGEFVFPGRSPGGPLNVAAMLRVIGRMKQSGITTHGFRSTFRDWAAETTGYPNHVLEMALAHAVSNQVEAAYRRGDLFEKRKRLMAEWASYCNSPLVVSGAVVPLRGGKR
jgi:integrase